MVVRDVVAAAAPTEPHVAPSEPAAAAESLDDDIKGIIGMVESVAMVRGMTPGEVARAVADVISRGEVVKNKKEPLPTVELEEMTHETTLQQGKHKGLSVGHVCEADPKYMKWVLDNVRASSCAEMRLFAEWIRKGYRLVKVSGCKTESLVRTADGKIVAGTCTGRMLDQLGDFTAMC